MEHTSLYRKYRPDTFDKMIGQEHIRQTLKNAIASKSIAHAYLFTGTRGTGKTSTAKVFAKAINCLHPKEDGSPCNECEVCKALSDQNNLDVVEINVASNNSIDDARELIEKSKYRPINSKYKVYILDEVHMLTRQAFNALLKTLEEPPEHIVFILATTEVQQIPATILSRCLRFDFRLIPKDKIAQHIEHIFEDLNIDFSKEACYAIADAGKGSVRDALSVADMVLSYCGKKRITYQDVLDILGTSSPEKVVELAEYILQGKISQALEATNKIISSGKSVSVLCEDLAGMLNNIMYAKNCKEANNSLLLPQNLFDSIQKASIGITNYKIYRASEIFTEVQNTLRHSTLPKIVLEIAVAKACDVSTSINTDGIINRVKDLEAFRRSMQGSTFKEGTTLTPQRLLGHLLNTLREAKLTTEGIIAKKIRLEQIKIENKICVVELDNKAIFDEVNAYSDTYARIIKMEYHEISELQIVFKPSIKEQNTQAINKLFGE